MSSASSTRDLFFSESRDMLADMERALLSLEEHPEDIETMNALFRSIHTIKGSAGMFGMNYISGFTHHVENVLDLLRQNKIELDEQLSDLLLLCHDHVSALLDYFSTGDGLEISDALDQQSTRLIEDLEKYSKNNTLIENKSENSSDTKVKSNEKSDISPATANRFWHISLRLHDDIFTHGLDPFSFLSYLKTIGTIEACHVIDCGVPLLDDYDAQKAYIGFEIDFDTDCDKNTIADVFSFMEDDCELRILPPYSSIAMYYKLLRDLDSSGGERLGEILLKIGSLTEQELEYVLSEQRKFNESHTTKKLIGNIIAEEKLAHPAVIQAALDKQKQAAQNNQSNRQSIRVDAEKLDQLINLVGELVITGANIQQLVAEKDIDELPEPVSHMTRLIDDIRNTSLNARMVQIGETFSRFRRVVRDLSSEMRKEIELVINGAETELDKTIVEKISDPLMHLVRNAIDHGIQSPEERKLRGKPEKGTIRLEAYNETGSVIIKISDDGEGLRADRIRAKAIERGLLNPETDLPDKDLYQYIFEPGFSTAEKITSVSGRGVGMDVVKKNIKALRGNVIIDSVPGEGATFKIQLPLTLAIVDGFRVEVEKASYVIPLDMVTECLEVQGSELTNREGGNFFNLRNELLPYICIRRFFNLNDYKEEYSNIVVVEYAGHRAGLVVDRLFGEFQTVIKPLGKVFSRMNWLTGATIMGNGDIALILDVPMLIQLARLNNGNR